MYELVNSVPMPVREYSGQRVVTFRDIDTLHHRPEGTAKRNFNKNRKYFIEGIDFFTINQPYEIRTVGFERQQGGTPESIVLVTESGYLMVVKSFRDELSWNIQRQLVNSYFRIREQADIYSDLLQRQNELESRIERLENNGIRLPVQNRQENAMYIMERLEQDGGTVFHKGEILRLCRKIRTRQVTEALKLLADNGYISYQRIQNGERGKPAEIVEIIRNPEN